MQCLISQKVIEQGKQSGLIWWVLVENRMLIYVNASFKKCLIRIELPHFSVIFKGLGAVAEALSAVICLQLVAATEAAFTTRNLKIFAKPFHRFARSAANAVT